MVELVDTLVLEASLRVRVRVSLGAPDFCIVSSAVERRPYKANVSGSTPLRCTKLGSVAERLKAAVC